MKLTYKGREIEDNAVDYGDGTVMICFKDDGDVTLALKKDIEVAE
jgi:hypothetical protein